MLFSTNKSKKNHNKRIGKPFFCFVRNLLISYEAKEKLLYLVFGALTTLVNFLIYYFFVKFLQIYYLYGNAVAWILSVCFAYLTNRKYVFASNEKSKHGIAREIVAFFSLRGLSGLVDMLFLFILVTLFSVNDTISKIAVNVLVIVMNYIFSKFIIFKKKD